MRLLSLRVQRFGALVERSFELDRHSMVLEGPNEAGKSSFHGAVETLFYGFHPASREAHPYSARGASPNRTERGPAHPETDSLHLSGLVELADGRRLRVERRLGAQAELRVAADGAAFSGPWLKNVPLDSLQAIPRSLFRAVYSLTANEVSEPSDEGIQDLIDDLLLGNKGPAWGAAPARVAQGLGRRAPPPLAWSQPGRIS